MLSDATLQTAGGYDWDPEEQRQRLSIRQGVAARHSVMYRYLPHIHPIAEFVFCLSHNVHLNGSTMEDWGGGDEFSFAEVQGPDFDFAKFSESHRSFLSKFY